MATWPEGPRYSIQPASLGTWLKRVRLVPKSEEELARACAVFELEKACYELRYELNNRPGWASIPAGGILRILESEVSG